MTDTPTEINERIARKLGWVRYPGVSSPYWRKPDGDSEYVLSFYTSVDASLAPGGPMEWLRERGWRILEIFEVLDGHFEVTLEKVDLDQCLLGKADTMPAALALAIDAAMSQEETK